MAGGAGGQIRWEGERARRWLGHAAAIDRQLAPVTQLLFDGAQLAAGERVLDVGCGSGPTTRRAAGLVGPDGWVGGIDVSADMLAAAEEAGAGDPTNERIDWIAADVGSWAPTIEPVDAVISRFGVMFFDDPVTAFANLAAACRPGGRLCAMVWDRRDRSALFEVPLAATVGVLAAHGLPIEPPPVDEAAFSLHEPAVVTALLTAAGWSDAEAVVHPVQLPAGGGVGPEAAADVLIDVGPSRALTEGVGASVRAEVVEAIAAALAGHLDGDGHVVLAGSVLRVQARRR